MLEESPDLPTPAPDGAWRIVPPKRKGVPRLLPTQTVRYLIGLTDARTGVCQGVVLCPGRRGQRLPIVADKDAVGGGFNAHAHLRDVADAALRSSIDGRQPIGLAAR